MLSSVSIVHAPARQEFVMPNRILLIAEDFAAGQRLCADLQHYGLMVDIARSQNEALVMSNGNKPGAILLSMDEPDQEGYDICNTLKKHPTTCGVPVIVLASRDEASAVLAAFRAGAQDYIIQDTFIMYNLIEALRRLKML
jgi:PleD family two-component response regulator